MAQREGERDGTALRGRDTERDGEIAPTALAPPDRVREGESVVDGTDADGARDIANTERERD